MQNKFFDKVEKFLKQKAIDEIDKNRRIDESLSWSLLYKLLYNKSVATIDINMLNKKE